MQDPQTPAPPNDPPGLGPADLIAQLNAGLDDPSRGDGLEPLFRIKDLLKPPDDPLQVPKFWLFAGVAVVVVLVGGWVAVDPRGQHTSEHQTHGLTAAIASLTGLAGFFMK